jgi:hypothetical protein
MHTVRWRIAAALAAASLVGCAAPARTTQPASTTGPASASRLPAKRATLLTGVSCVTDRSCVVVGWYYTSAAGPRRTLAERWDGRRWQVQHTAAPDGVLTGVSCPVADACLAVGDPAQAWTDGQSRRVAGGGGLSSVSCVSATWCQAVGSDSAARWTGRAWQPERVPVPAHRITTLASVSCVSVRFCLAVGDAQRPPAAQPSPGVTDQALAELWDGARWRMIRPADPAPRTALAGVSCTSRFCLAVGATGAQYALAERWAGTGWQVEPVQDVNRIGYTVLDAVSCTARGCVAAGSYNGGVLVTERWDGRRWRLTRSGSIVGPPSVSCAAGGCVVVVSGKLQWLRLRT